MPACPAHMYWVYKTHAAGTSAAEFLAAQARETVRTLEQNLGPQRQFFA